ncbi:MAG: hypothetical protein ABR920_00915 [Terriglobales bacterium]
MARRMPLFVLVCICTGSLYAQDLAGIEIHGFVTQSFLFSSNNNYLTMQSSTGSLQWTDGAVSVSDSLTDKLRVGIQLHMYQLGELGGSNVQIDWASGDYRVNDHFGFRGGKVKTVLGLFNDSQDVDAIFLWILLPQSIYQIDNKSFLLSHVGGEVYGELPLGSRAGKLQYRGYAGQATLDLTGGYVKQFADAGLVFTTAPGGKVYGGDLRWEAPLKGLTLGSTAHIEALDGTAPAGSIHVPPFQINAEYAQFQKGKFYFAGEYWRVPLNAILTIGPAVIPVPVDARSWYAMGSYRFSEKLHLGSYYSHLVNKAGDTTQPGNYSKDWVVSGRYDFNAYFYGKIEGHFLHGTGLGYYNSTNPNGLKPNSNMLAARIGFSF